MPSLTEVGRAPTAPARALSRQNRSTAYSLRERQRLTMTLDITIAAGAAGLAASWLGGSGLDVLAATGLVMVGLLAVDAYEPWRRWTRGSLAFRGLKALAVSALLAFLAAVVASGWFAALPGTVWLAGLSVLAARVLAYDWFAETPVRRVVIVGADEAGRQMAEELGRRAPREFEVVGYIDDRPAARASGLPVLGSTARLTAINQAYQIDLVAIRTILIPQRQALVDAIERGTNVVTFPDLYEEIAGRIPVGHLDTAWFLSELRGANRQLYAMAKRVLDVTVASVGLAATALLLPAIAIAIRLGGGAGPIFYSQVRVGHRGHEFRIYKFRTMRQDAEAGGATWAAANDDRVTAVGRLLRQTRLDELPQFWNVLKGEMSVVGPRPERPEFVEVLAREIPFYQRRHMVLPGLTGWAQVRFPYGASVDDGREKLQYDLFYLKNRSFYLDLKIMLRTFGVMAKKIGAR